MAPVPASEPVSTHGIAKQLFARASTYTQIPSLVRRFTSSILKVRQQIVAIPATYPASSIGPSPGTVAGIVLGVVLGLAFILWVLYTVFNANNPSGATEVEIIKTRGSRKSRPARSDRTRSEIIEVSRTRARSAPRRTQEIIVEEEVRRPAPQDEEDVVVVIEEHSPVRRQRRSSGYRNVDPNEFGGGRRDRRGVR